jgi:hypothetical protein
MPQNACSTHEIALSQRNLINLLLPTDPVREFLSNLPASAWNVISFDPKSRTACVRIDNGKSLVVITVSFTAVIGKNTV